MRRPTFVTFLGVLIGLQAAAASILGVVYLVVSTDIVALERIGMGRATTTAVGLFLLGLGLITFVMIGALWQGSPAARAVVACLTALSIAASFGSLGSDVLPQATLLVLLGLNGLVLLGLYGPPTASSFFARDRAF